jgi:hypothetical protein
MNSWEPSEGEILNAVTYGEDFSTAGWLAWKAQGTKEQGKHLNNYPENQTKVFATAYLLEKKIQPHIDCSVLWGFPGKQEGMDILSDATLDSTNWMAQSWDAFGVDDPQEMVEDMEKHKAMGVQLRLNASVLFKLTEKASLTLRLANLQDIPSLYKDKDERPNHLSTPRRVLRALKNEACA